MLLFGAQELEIGLKKLLSLENYRSTLNPMSTIHDRERCLKTTHDGLKHMGGVW